MRPRVISGSFVVEPKRLGDPLSVTTNPTLSVALLPIEEIFRTHVLAKNAIPDVGVLVLYCPANTYASLSVNENCDRTVRTDMLEGLRRIALSVAAQTQSKNAAPPTKTNHASYVNPLVFDLLTRRCLALPVCKGQLMLGTWQGVYLFYDSYYCSSAERGAPKIEYMFLEGGEYERVAHNGRGPGSYGLGTYMENLLVPSVEVLHVRPEPSGGAEDAEEEDKQKGREQVVNQNKHGSLGCLVHLHTHHTSASLCIRDVDSQSLNAQNQENAIQSRTGAIARVKPIKPQHPVAAHVLPSASGGKNAVDLEFDVMRRLVPDRWNDEFFQHTYEGRDDMTGHMKCTLLGCSTLVDAGSQRAWKEVVLNEHREGSGNTRKVSLVNVLYRHRQRRAAADDGTNDPNSAEGEDNDEVDERACCQSDVVAVPGGSAGSKGGFTDITSHVRTAMGNLVGASGEQSSAPAAAMFVGANGGGRLLLTRKGLDAATWTGFAENNTDVPFLLPCSVVLPPTAFLDSDERLFFWAPPPAPPSRGAPPPKTALAAQTVTVVAF